MRRCWFALVPIIAAVLLSYHQSMLSIFVNGPYLAKSLCKRFTCSGIMAGIAQTVRMQQEEVQHGNMELQNSSTVDSSEETSATNSPPSKIVKLKDKHRSPKRFKPNVFVSLPITDAMVRKKMIDIQQIVLDQDNSLEELQISPSTFHLTLMVIHLDESTQLGNVQKALDECTEVLRSLLSPVELNKLSSFGQNVVFMTTGNAETKSTFKQAAVRVRDIFTEHGLPSTDSREPEPHVTLFKMSRGRGKPKKIPRKLHESIEDTDCGTQTFDRLQLCSMTAPKQPNGYYHIIYERDLESAASPTGPTGEEMSSTGS